MVTESSPFSTPGFRSAILSEESQVWFAGRDGQNLVSTRSVTFDSTATDAGNTGTTSTIRGGNVIGIQDSDGNAYPVDPDGNDGTQEAVGILENHFNLLENSVAVDKSRPIMRSGFIKEGECIGLTEQAKAQLMRNGFIFDGLSNGAGFLVHPRRTVLKITNYTVLASDNGTLFVTTTADTNYTLPTIAAGLSFEFMMAANFELVITGSNNIIAFNDISASTYTWTTTGEQIGVRVRVLAVYIAATTLKWLIEDISAPPSGAGVGYTLAIA